MVTKHDPAFFLMQKLTHKQLQREATQRLNEFMGQIRNQSSVDLSAKNLGEEGCAYVAEALAFNDRCSSHSNASQDIQKHAGWTTSPACMPGKFASSYSITLHRVSRSMLLHKVYLAVLSQRVPPGNAERAMMPCAKALNASGEI